MKPKIFSQGAEALILKNKNNIIKDRIKKSYRFPLLDQRIRKQRTKKEAKLLEKASKIISVPKIIKQSKYEIELELIKGKKLSQNLDKLKNSNNICGQIGVEIAKLHGSNIVHGDLTTSNMILDKNKVFFIDFGLGFESSHSEDKAVDLHVLKEALEARHFRHASEFWKAVLNGYSSSINAKEIFKRLEAVEKRGRYKQ